MCAAIQDIFEDTRSIVEPSGALAVAGIKKYVARENLAGKTLISINCGANMNFDRLRYVAERADIGAQRELLLAVEIPEGPGSFLRFCEVLGKRSVTEFNYRQMCIRDSATGAQRQQHDGERQHGTHHAEREHQSLGADRRGMLAGVFGESDRLHREHGKYAGCLLYTSRCV